MKIPPELFKHSKAIYTTSEKNVYYIDDDLSEKAAKQVLPTLLYCFKDQMTTAGNYKVGLLYGDQYWHSHYKFKATFQSAGVDDWYFCTIYARHARQELIYLSGLLILEIKDDLKTLTIYHFPDMKEQSTANRLSFCETAIAVVKHGPEYIVQLNDTDINLDDIF